MQEFGKGKIPPRPAFRQAFDSHRDAYAQFLKDTIGATIDALSGGGGRDWKAAEAILMKNLKTLGVVHAGDIQTSIRDLKNPVNADYTIQKKGSSNPLIDTGRLRQSVTSEVVRKRWKTKKGK
jgi:hypothetical protein